jgi:hypothetical protein
MLLIGLIGGILSTVALVVSAVLANQPGPPPGQGQGQGQGPPPMPSHSLIALVISAAIFVVAWAMVIAAITRDQVMRKITDSAAGRAQMLVDLHEWMLEEREQTARERAAAQAELVAQLANLREFGEQRETDGYLNAMRAAQGLADAGDVRPLRRVPPPQP